MTASKKNHQKQQRFLWTPIDRSSEELEQVNKRKPETQHAVSYRANHRDRLEGEPSQFHDMLVEESKVRKMWEATKSLTASLLQHTIFFFRQR